MSSATPTTISTEVPLAITKAVEDAKKNLFAVAKHGTTITHESLGAFDAARVLLRPASPGTGVIAGGGVRAVLELGGIRDVLAKSLGTTNPINMEHGLQKVEVFVKGPGSGRETAIRSLQAAGLEILGVKDVSPQAHNGVRQKKRRRV